MSGSQLLLLGGTPQQVVSDPNFEYTTLLLPGNGTNGAQNNTFLDSSTNNFTITRNGNTTQGTFSPFSQTGWGNYFDGNGDYLRAAANAAFEFGSGDFTVECWVYAVKQTNTFCQTFVSKGLNASTGAEVWFIQLSSTGYLGFNSGNGGAVAINDSVLFPVNQWTHVAAVRNGGTFSLYKNGTLVGTASATAVASGGDLYIGGQWYDPAAATRATEGYISNVRVVKGTAVYTANFTPPTAPLTAITNTSLLTCQSNRFIDNSTNNFAITRFGDTSVQAFSPFNPTAAWSASTNGGSGYFDGSGDYLTAPDNAAFDLGAGAFTLECFAYLNARAGAYDTLIAQWNNSSDSWLLLLSGNTIQFYGNGALAKSESVTITTGQWYHFACTRDSSNNLRLYANGVKLGSDTAYSTTLINSTASPSIGCRGDGLSTTNFNGYLSSVRVIKGSAEYTGSTYTVPTAPLTAISGTSLLLNNTNAGIYDATSKNDLETVGNAQISTTQSKFGGSSMYFDGTDDRLLAPTSPNLTFGTGDFTIEAWVNRSTSGSVIHFIDFRGSNNAGSNPVFYWQTNNFIYYTNENASGDNQIQTSNAITSSSGWVHLAIVRFGTTLTVYVNGLASGSVTYSTNVLGGNPVTIANRFNNSGAYTGYINDLRITKGVARYTANFTPPTTAFPLL